MSEIINVFTLIFLTSSILMALMKRFSHPPIPAYIIAGLLISRFIPQKEILMLSQLGIAFLVFIFGVKTDLERIKTVGAESLSTAIMQVTVVGLAVYIIGIGVGFNTLNSIYLAAAAAFSSSLIGLELVKSEVRLDIVHGRLAEAIQLIQDLMALVLISVLASEFGFSVFLENISFLVLSVGLALGFRQYLFDHIAELTEGSQELLMLTSLTILTSFIGLAEITGNSIVVGAFAAGLAVSKFPFNMEILDTTGSLKDFFAILFFVSLGALVSWPSQLTILITTALIISTVLLKPAITSLGLLINGYDRRTSYLTGLSLDQVSEFALIIAIQGLIAGNIMPQIFQSIILAATGTMLISSYTSRHQEEIYQRLSKAGIIEVNGRKINEKTNIPEELHDHVILLGYDTQGKKIAEALREEDQPFILIENDPEKIAEVSDKKGYYVFGDAMDSETWDRAHVKNARLIVSTVPQRNISERVLRLDTQAKIIVRSSELNEARKLLEKGAFYVNVPDILSSEELLDHLRGVLDSISYGDELRRRKLLEIRKQLKD